MKINFFSMLGKSIFLFSCFLLNINAFAQTREPLPSGHPAFKMSTEERMLCAVALESLGAEFAHDEHAEKAAIFRQAAAIDNNDPGWESAGEHYTAMVGGSAENAVQLATTCVLSIDPAFQVLSNNANFLSLFQCLAVGQVVGAKPVDLARLEFDLRQMMDQLNGGDIVRSLLFDEQFQVARSTGDFGENTEEFKSCASKGMPLRFENTAYKTLLEGEQGRSNDWQHVLFGEIPRKEFLCAALNASEMSAAELGSSDEFQSIANTHRNVRVAGQAFWGEETTEMTDEFLQDLAGWFSDRIKALPADVAGRLKGHCAVP